MDRIFRADRPPSKLRVRSPLSRHRFVTEGLLPNPQRGPTPMPERPGCRQAVIRTVRVPAPHPGKPTCITETHRSRSPPRGTVRSRPGAASLLRISPELRAYSQVEQDFVELHCRRLTDVNRAPIK